ncbi:PD-(D/E)XK nuclease family protein [Saccharopolyspora sp. NFXS83]|uniref:RecB family exonuclease n=1 Tax=Saccharopolyspora sp. NFXS83 TaxID=2993560 RepID=UPI00224B63DC|nr:PD-(D/E)XK nuclease family protein [Saccharopolyspora sp. NFXS83]MCX2733402.1 PD-(D/E)XK nuclease family protein [Saccharopolyspora sp. NFXS83]
MQGQLGLEGIPGKLVRVTPAKLANWDRCPRKFRMTYLDRPAPSRSGARANATLGAVVHNALKAFFELPIAQRTPEKAVLLVRQCWKSDGFADFEQADEYRGRAQRWVAEYVERLGPDADPVAVERWVSAPAGTIIAEGRVDRIDRRDGALVVVDYKTGRRASTDEDARDSRALALYAVATRKTLRGETGRVELHHLPSGRVGAWEHDRASLDEHVRAAERSAAELQAASDTFEEGDGGRTAFPPKPGAQCAWCEFRAHCPEGQQAAPPAAPWAGLAE